MADLTSGGKGGGCYGYGVGGGGRYWNGDGYGDGNGYRGKGGDGDGRGDGNGDGGGKNPPVLEDFDHMSENEWIESFEFCVRHKIDHKQIAKLRTQGLPHAVVVNLEFEPIYHIGETDQWMKRNWDYDAGKIRRARTGTGRFEDRIVRRGLLKVVLDPLGRKSYAVPTEREVLQCKIRALSPKQKGAGFAREGV